MEGGTEEEEEGKLPGGHGGILGKGGGGALARSQERPEFCIGSQLGLG